MNRSYIAWTILGLFSISLMYVGKELADRQGLLAAFILSLLINSLVYFYGDFRLKKLFHSKTIEGRDPYNLNLVVDQLARKLHIPTPEVLICDLSTPTAYSTGRSVRSASLIFSKSLLEKLEPEEIRAVAAFEMQKIATHFTFSASLCSAIAAGSIGLAEKIDKLLFWKKNFDQNLGPLTGLISPIITRFIRIVQNKSAFFKLDKYASELTGEPRALAQSLWKLDSLASTQPELVPKDTAHIFFINPLPKYGWAKMFQTQPSAKERIEQLIGQYPI